MAKRAPRSHAIVVGTDFSAGSHRALARAAELARRHRAALHVVHAASRIPRALTLRFSSANDDKLRESLDAEVDKLRRASVDAHAHLMTGEPVKCLTAKARTVSADLVVVGTRGNSVLAEMIGSTAERLLASNGARVLLVRRSATRPYGKVVVAASDESRLSEQFAAAGFVSARPAAVLHTYEGPYESALISRGASIGELASYRSDARREAALTMGKLLTKAGIEKSRLALLHGNPFHLLDRLNPGWLIVLSRGRSRARRLVFGSVTRAVVAYGHSDVLLV